MIHKVLYYFEREGIHVHFFPMYLENIAVLRTLTTVQLFVRATCWVTKSRLEPIMLGTLNLSYSVQIEALKSISLKCYV